MTQPNSTYNLPQPKPQISPYTFSKAIGEMTTSILTVFENTLSTGCSFVIKVIDSHATDVPFIKKVTDTFREYYPYILNGSVSIAHIYNFWGSPSTFICTYLLGIFLSTPLIPSNSLHVLQQGPLDSSSIKIGICGSAIINWYLNHTDSDGKFFSILSALFFANITRHYGGTHITSPVINLTKFIFNESTIKTIQTAMTRISSKELKSDSKAQQSNSIPHTENASLGAITSANSKSVYPNSEAQQSNSIPHTENASLGAITSASSKSVYPNSEAQQSNSIPHTENASLGAITSASSKSVYPNSEAQQSNSIP
ncbi:MAG: hypothetical protein AAF443_06720, partial [Chlamydiota bacterium]